VVGWVYTGLPEMLSCEAQENIEYLGGGIDVV
jgi:hypothetical protein